MIFIATNRENEV